MRNALVLCLALAAPLYAEPPAAFYGTHVLLVGAASNTDGVKGPRVGVLVGHRARLSESIALLVEASVVNSPKIGAGGGTLFAAMFDVEHSLGRWYWAAGVRYAVQETPFYSKEAWAPQLSAGRQGGAWRLSGVLKLPDSTPNRAGSLGLALEWRRSRGVLRRGILRWGLAWVRHRDGEGVAVSGGIGVNFG